MVVVKEVGAVRAVIGRASSAVSETEPQQSGGLPIVCVYVCMSVSVRVCVGVCVSVGGIFQREDAKVCPSNLLLCQHMKGCVEKMCDP